MGESHSVWEVHSEMRPISILVFVCSLGIFNANAAPMSDNFNKMKYGMIPPNIFRYAIPHQANPYQKRNSNSMPKMTVAKKNVEGGGSEIQRGLQSALRPEGGGSEILTGLQSALRSEGGESEIQRGLQSALRSEGGGSEILTGLQSALRSEGGESEIQRGLQSALRSEGGESEIQR